jgi:aldehyde:ferredoxin oxidoreductase
MGSLCGLTDPEEVVYLSNLCNILGMDTISTGSVIAFAMDLFQRGILSEADTDGLDLSWGNADAMETIMGRMARREGFGAVLSDGVEKAAERIGKGAERYAYHVKGVEMYGADPRGLHGTALAYAVSFRGADFTSVYPVPEFRYTPEKAFEAFGTPKAVDFSATEGKGAMIRFCMIVSAVLDSLGLCKVAALSVGSHFDLEREAKLASVFSGIGFTAEALMTIGERIVNMEKQFNLRCGAGRASDTLPAKFTQERIAKGPAKGARLRLAPMVADFYRCMGWDDLGVPTAATLRRLGIGGGGDG